MSVQRDGGNIFIARATLLAKLTTDQRLAALFLVKMLSNIIKIKFIEQEEIVNLFKFSSAD